MIHHCAIHVSLIKKFILVFWYMCALHLLLFKRKSQKKKNQSDGAKYVAARENLTPNCALLSLIYQCLNVIMRSDPDFKTLVVSTKVIMFIRVKVSFPTYSRYRLRDRRRWSKLRSVQDGTDVLLSLEQWRLTVVGISQRSLCKLPVTPSREISHLLGPFRHVAVIDATFV